MTVTELRAKIPHADGLGRLAERASRHLWDWRRRRREESLTGCLFRMWRAGSADHSLLRGRPGGPPPCRLRCALAAGAGPIEGCYYVVTRPRRPGPTRSDPRCLHSWRSWRPSRPASSRELPSTSRPLSIPRARAADQRSPSPNSAQATSEGPSCKPRWRSLARARRDGTVGRRGPPWMASRWAPARRRGSLYAPRDPADDRAPPRCLPGSQLARELGPAEALGPPPCCPKRGESCGVPDLRLSSGTVDSRSRRVRLLQGISGLYP